MLRNKYLYINYMKYLIYRITINGNIYIGSTVNLQKRLYTHKAKYDAFCNGSCKRKIYEIIYLNGGWNCCQIELIEEYECETNIEARIKEEYWKRFYNANMNTKKAFESEDEFKIRVKTNNTRRNPINNPKRDQTTVFCNCGGHYLTFNKNTHLKSKKHLMYLQTNEGATDCESE